MDYGIFKIWHTIKHIFLRKDIAFIMCIVSTLGANSTYESYLQAHNAYANGDYAQALELFANLPETSFSVLYNRGWAWYKNGDAYHALTSFFKAARFASGSEQIQAYTMYEQMQKELGISKARFFYDALFVRFNAYVPDLFLQLMSLLLLMLLLLCFIYYSKGLLFYGIFLCAIASTTITYLRYQEKKTILAFAKETSTLLHAGPGSEYGIVSKVPQGTLLTIVSQHDLWYCVAFDYQRGWVPAKDVDLVV